MVGNGNKIQCSSFCPNAPISIHTYTFSIFFYLLPIEGADVVLGMDWLHSLGPLMADFSKLQLSFTHNGLPITLHNTTNLLHSQASFTHLCHKSFILYISSLLTHCHHHPALTDNPNPQLYPIFYKHIVQFSLLPMDYLRTDPTITTSPLFHTLP